MTRNRAPCANFASSLPPLVFSLLAPIRHSFRSKTPIGGQPKARFFQDTTCPTSPSKATRKEKRSFPKCMSFVPAPQQANAAGANNAPNQVNTAAAAAESEVSDKDLLFKLRTFDVYWVDKSALMYRDGFDKVRLEYDLGKRWLPWIRQ